MRHSVLRSATAGALAGITALALGTAASAGSEPVGSEPAGIASDDTSGGVTTVTIEITDDGCAAADGDYTSGAYTFEVANLSAAGVTEFEVMEGDRILGEKENLPPGFSGSFSLNLGPGDYTLYCPGASTETFDFTVTGDELVAEPTNVGEMLQQGADGYLGYVRTQVQELLDAVTVLDEAIQAGDLEASQEAYYNSRPFYERIEPLAESFVLNDVNLDSQIDLRADDVEPTELAGFHRIEYGLWVDETTDGLAEVSTQLIADVTSLQELVGEIESLQPAELANGAVGLLDEAACCKITGEEERYSHIDILDMTANVEGSQQAFAYLEEGLNEIDADLVATINERFDALDAAVAELADPDEPSGYVLFDDLTDDDITALSQALQAVAEPLSEVAAKVLTA